MPSSSFALLGTTVIKVDPQHPDDGSITKAAAVVRRGGLVAFPTETVYGLGADGLSAEAVERIFAAKGRPATNPLILHVTGLEQVEELGLAAEVPDAARRLAAAFWPGPLALIMRRTEKVPDLVAAGRPTFSCRAPDHPVALALIRAAGRPLAAPSANLSGRPSPVTAKHVLDDLSGRVDLVLDAGQTPLGIESTVLDLTDDPPRILRQGAVAKEELVEVIGHVAVAGADAPSSPAAALEHYRPRVPVYLVEWAEFMPNLAERVDDAAVRLARTARNLVQAAGDEGAGVAGGAAGRVGGRSQLRVGLLLTSETARALDPGASPGTLEVLVVGSAADPKGIAAGLYRCLRELEERGVAAIVVEGINPAGIGAVVMDRLRQAAGPRVVP